MGLPRDRAGLHAARHHAVCAGARPAAASPRTTSSSTSSRSAGSRPFPPWPRSSAAMPPWLAAGGRQGDRCGARGAADGVSSAASGRGPVRVRQSGRRHRRQGSGAWRPGSRRAGGRRHDIGSRGVTATQTSFIRGAGGFGGPSGPSPAPHSMPRSSRRTWSTTSRPWPRARSSTGCRGTGTRCTPIRRSPARPGSPARSCTGSRRTGSSAGGSLGRWPAGIRAGLAAFDTRFSAPVLPGETLRTELWRDGDVVSFQTRVAERDVLALSNGRAVLRD